MTDGGIALVLSDVDGTLVTSDKVLTRASIDAVAALRDAGIGFAVTSGRPPRGMSMLIEPLSISTPIGGFNGGLLVDPAMQILEKRSIPAAVVPSVIDALDGLGLQRLVLPGRGVVRPGQRRSTRRTRVEHL